MSIAAAFAPIIFLRDLREECLAHSEKRMPKWKFRIAPDLIMQLQPKPGYILPDRLIALGQRKKLVRFDGIAIMIAIGTASASMFADKPDSKVTPWWRRHFEIVAHVESEWRIEFKGGTYTRGHHDGFGLLDGRIAAVFAGDFFSALTSTSLLGNNCLVCGKGLTDPASLARPTVP